MSKTNVAKTLGKEKIRKTLSGVLLGVFLMGAFISCGCIGESEPTYDVYITCIDPYIPTYEKNYEDITANEVIKVVKNCAESRSIIYDGGCWYTVFRGDSIEVVHEGRI